MLQSLHNHTTVSDGEASYSEFLKAAGNCGLSVVAFTGSAPFYGVVS